jgi:phage baseplate assembly protein W
MATLNTKRLFTGFSTVNSPKNGQLTDLKLVEQDLMNHFFTRKNERRMMPGWGCGIWELLFDPFDDATKDAVIHEAKKVIDYDPRVKLDTIVVDTYEYGLKITMKLYYVPFNAIGTFSLNFDKRSVQNSY